MKILGVRVDNINYQQALEEAKKLIDAGGRHYIVTPNPEIVVAAQKDREFKEILNKSSLSIPDGIGLVWGAKILGGNLPERVTGTDLLEGLAALSEEHGYSLFLLGGGEGVAEGAAQKLKNRSLVAYASDKYRSQLLRDLRPLRGLQNSKLKIDTAAGPLLNQDGKPVSSEEAEKEREVIEKINQFRPDVLAVAFGPPKQEKWIERNLPQLNVKLAIGVGGALSYLSGEKHRAPLWARRIGFEWAFRLLKEPARFKRQLSLPYFSYLVFKERFKK